MLLRLFLILFTFLLFCEKVLPQQPFVSFKAPDTFKRDDFSVSYFDPISYTYHINFKTGTNITRCIYDTNFGLIQKYSLISDQITFSEKEWFGIKFVSPICTKSGVFEIYSDQDDILIYQPDFNLKKDSLIESFRFSKKRKEERILALMPDEEDLKILTYAEKENTMKVYQWFPGQPVKTTSFILPNSTLTKEEEKIYTKECRIKFKNLGQLKSTRINSIQSLPEYNHVFYSKQKIYIVLELSFSLGRYVMDFDLNKENLITHNYFINSITINTGSNKYIKKTPVSTVFDSILVLQNSSYYTVEFLFYNLRTQELIKKYSVPVKDSIYELMHSSFRQKGTYGSKNQEKEIENEKAFMRKIRGSFSYISISSLTQDSIVLTLASLQYTEGIGGTLLSLSTKPIGYMANIHIGNLQLVPYLTSRRYKLLYAHSKFNSHTLEPTSSRSVTTVLDEILDNFMSHELSSNNSFLIQRNADILMGVFNKNNGMFDVYKFVNSN